VFAERVAPAGWRLKRVTAYEAAAIVERQHLEPPQRSPAAALAIDKITRYETHLNRQLLHAVQELESMR